MDNFNSERFFTDTYKYLLNYIEPNTKVIDLGCGTGNLMELLEKDKNCKVQGIEIESPLVQKCVNKGLFVYNGDIMEGITDFQNKRFDYAVLSNVLQALDKPKEVLEEALRVGKKVIVSFPNFGSLKVRLKLLFSGKMPVTKELPYTWYDTPNIHFFTVFDFKDLCKEMNIEILDELYLTKTGNDFRRLHIFPNIRGDFAVFVVKRELPIEE
ncbi:MAG: methionine biosynthesis protein MetW [Abditibacteriota bacterium]|nr:methionine biosynthesis protein MetW [Abditibacteriota bacterium]